VRLLLMPLPDPFDADLTTFWLPWMAYGAENGLARLYQNGQPLVNYPPLYLALLVGLGKLYGLVVPGFEYTPLQSVLIKLPAVLADLAITALLYGAARRIARAPGVAPQPAHPAVIARMAADEATLAPDARTGIPSPSREIASPQTARNDDEVQTAPAVSLTEAHDRTTAHPNDRTTAHPNDRTTAHPNDRTTAPPNDRTTAHPNDRTTARWFPLVAAGLWALNPAILYVSAFWGQVDSIHTLWMLAALLAALGRRWGWSGLFMGLALLTKLQALILLPLLLALAWRYSLRAVVLGAAALAGTLALGLLPFVLNGALDQVLAVYFGSVGFYPRLSVNAFNGWFLVQSLSVQLFGRELLDTARVVGPVTLRVVGLGLLAGYVGLALWFLWRTLQPGPMRPAGAPTAATRDWLAAETRLLVFFAAGLLVFGFFSLATEMHERYGLPALAFLALPAAYWRRVFWPYLLLTAVFSANLLRMLPWGPGIFNLLESIPGDRLLVSAASVLLFAWLTALYLAEAGRQRRLAPAGGATGEGS
jgi:Gpi18-like mannosyltransferase